MKKYFLILKTFVKPKKHLGQHFLNDLSVAEKIATMFKVEFENDQSKLIEIGPGMGVLTQFLVNNYNNPTLIEIDKESIQYLKNQESFKFLRIIEGDILNDTLLNEIIAPNTYLIGNYPYNISSQIVFKVLQFHHQIEGFGGMFQKEVAERLVAPKGSKTYGILSVLLNAFYDSKYLFTVEPGVFIPPPKVKSGVIKCVRKKDFVLPCSQKLFFDVVKTAFNQRRKTLRNALHKFNLKETDEFAKLRAEQLSVDEFIKLTLFIEKSL